MMPLAGLARRFQQLPQRQQAVFVQLMTMSASEFLDQWFETDPLKATMAASGIIGTYQGVKSPGTAYVLLHHYMGEIDGAFRAWGIPKGGTGGVSNAIGSAARALGRGDPHERAGRQRHRQGRPRGRRRARIGRGDPRRFDPVSRSTRAGRSSGCSSPGTLDPSFEEEVRRFKFRGSSGKVNLAVDRLPEFTSLPGAGEHLRGAISFSPSIDDMETAYDDAKYGHFSRKPYIDMIIPTLVDPSMAPPGKHVISCFVQYAPYKLAPELGTWDDQREAFGDAVIDRIAEFAPEHPRHHPPPQRPDAARHRADDRADRGQHLPGRAEPRAAVLQPAGARLRPVPDPGPRPVAVRLGDPPGRRDHGRERAHRRARGAPARGRKAA